MSTTFTFISPSEARQRTETSLNDIVGKVMYRINTAIQQDSAKGNFVSVFDFRTVELGNDQQEAVDTVKASLTELGYGVTMLRQFQAGSTIFEQISVNWVDDPDEPIDDPDEPIDDPDEPIDDPDEPINDPDEPIDDP